VVVTIAIVWYYLPVLLMLIILLILVGSFVDTIDFGLFGSVAVLGFSIIMLSFAGTIRTDTLLLF
jgi:hypothetical protein